MKAQLYHIQVNVRDAARSLPFYKALLRYLEYRTVYETDAMAGFSGRGADVWVGVADPGHAGAGFHRKRAGLNHLAFRVDRREDVDRFQAEFLAPRKLAPLYRTPREFPEYRPGYYAVFFEDPDRLKLELVHLPTAPPT
ncbi:MAG TPA: VOC family protein [Methylomirabilota bacterium]|nr:VOC family protein [Methylomirabilota bacterium]